MRRDSWPEYSGLYVLGMGRWARANVYGHVSLSDRDCPKSTLYTYNFWSLLMLHCIWRASRGHWVYRSGRCSVANMAPVKTQRLWFSTYNLIVIQSLFLQLTFHCFLLFKFFFPSQQPSGTFFCQPSFCSLPGAFQIETLEESGLTVVTGKWVYFQLEKLWNVTIRWYVTLFFLDAFNSIWRQIPGNNFP